MTDQGISQAFLQTLDRHKASNKKQRTANIGLAIWRLTCFVETVVQGSAFVLRMNFSAKNPPHRQAVAERRNGVFRNKTEKNA